MTNRPHLTASLLIAAALTLAAPAMAQDSAPDHSHAHDHDHDHDHAHDHAHGHSHARTPEAQAIYDGYFDDDQIQDRPLSDYAGDWQSVYPLLQDGTLAPVMARKAEKGDQTAEEYTAYYQTGYATETDRITIEGDVVTFYTGEQTLSGTYADDGFEVLTYSRGNRGVRFIFAKTEGDADAPDFIQFSDHGITPAKADHFHLYWGDDRAALLEEVTNWPTYYPSDLSPAQIVDEMLAH